MRDDDHFLNLAIAHHLNSPNMASFVIVLGVLLFVTLSEASCYSGCKFHFCDKRSSFIAPDDTDFPFTGVICAKGGAEIGAIGSSGESFVMDRRPIPISKWRPRGLLQPFSDTFFKTFYIDTARGDRSGVGCEDSLQNQFKYLHNRCFVLPFTSYQVLDRYTDVMKMVHPRGRPLRDCVSFTMRV